MNIRETVIFPLTKPSREELIREEILARRRRKNSTEKNWITELSVNFDLHDIGTICCNLKDIIRFIEWVKFDGQGRFNRYNYQISEKEISKELEKHKNEVKMFETVMQKVWGANWRENLEVKGRKEMIKLIEFEIEESII